MTTARANDPNDRSTAPVHILPERYDPGTAEPAWYERWEAAGLFVADPHRVEGASQVGDTEPRAEDESALRGSAAGGTKPAYAICLPPPNVTGVLHMGHAVNGTVQDVWARYRRMTGYEVLFLPGTDHAAIATQNVLERQLAAEGTSKEAIGRAAFEARAERWYAEVGGTIARQLRELGASLDWSRQRFTMDAAYVRAVRTAFVRFYDRGWLYRGPRIVNWCPRCRSAISDEEVQWLERVDALCFVRYPLADASGAGAGAREVRGDTGASAGTATGGVDGITIATVRPETLLADTGVAVHPEDDRYRTLVGRHAVLPLVGRRLPIVADAAVEQAFGSGALKVTPGHDAKDYEIGRRHGLPVVNGLRPDGRLDAPGFPAYDGRAVDEARAIVLRDLEAGGYLVRREPYTHQVGHCDRCGHVIEPLVSEQWFLKTGELARRALAASEAGRIRWHPERYERTYLDWLRGLDDWCVSRQLWLGHRIPVFTCPAGHRAAAVEAPGGCPQCGATPLTQDPDVLDTWFSSALWPFATLGWPARTADLGAFYPTALNGTDRQIINLWVSRMIMCGLELTGDVPFGDVAIHCTILSPDGRRMSKSRPETVVDPREVIGRYGADALRAWCAQVAVATQDVRFDDRRIEGYRRFGNKLWNATRLVLGVSGTLGASGAPGLPEREDALWAADRWILSRLQETVRTVTRGIEGFAFHLAVEAAHHFTWHELCDWYLEAAKPRLRPGDKPADPVALGVALHVLDTVCRLLHPFMPFLTEELWHRLPATASGSRDFLVRASWPAPDARLTDPTVEEQFGRLVRAVEAARQARSKLANPQYRARTAPEVLRQEERLAASLPDAVARVQGRLPAP